MSEISTQQRTIRPLFRLGRATVIPSPVEEIAHPGGLIVPLRYDGDSAVERGVLVHATADDRFGTEQHLPSGTVVYYRGGVAIAGVVVVELQDVIAYEADE